MDTATCRSHQHDAKHERGRNTRQPCDEEQSGAVEPQPGHGDVLQADPNQRAETPAAAATRSAARHEY